MLNAPKLKLQEAERECLDEVSGDKKEVRILAILADASNVEDMARVREIILQSKCLLHAIVACF